jgi:pSer/pThr/pTyr-binding forkhead associated (FHA) protein
MPYFVRKIGDPQDLSTEAIEIKAPSFSIGRLRECDCILDHPGVSRLHATVRSDQGKTFLCDKTSRNGTYVNHTRLVGEQQLLDGDLIQICDTYLIYRESLPATAVYPEYINKHSDIPSAPPSTKDFEKRFDAAG